MLSRIDLPLGTQGRARRIDLETIRQLDLVATLMAVGVPAARAHGLARDASPTELGPGLALTYDRDAHVHNLDQRLREAAERVVPRRRGRPRSR